MVINDFFKNFIIFGLIYLFVVWFDYVYTQQSVPIGVYGLIGNNGSTGLSGQFGPNGITNPHKFIINNIVYNKIGSVGPTGLQGINGPPGIDGFRGPIGIKGPDGPFGAIGEQGDSGIQGLPGVKGEDVNWYLSNTNKQDCVDGIYNEVGDSMCPEKTIMVGLQNIIGTENLKVKCCNLTTNIEVQQEKFKLIKKGLSTNPNNPFNDPLIY